MTRLEKLKEEFLEQEKTRQVKRVVASLYSVRLLPLLPGYPEIPPSVCDAIARKFSQLVQRGEARGFLVQRLGNDLLLQVNRLGGDPYRPTPDDDVWAAFREALQGEAELPRDVVQSLKSTLSLPTAEQWNQLRVRTLRFPFTERGAEPILVAKLLSGAVGGFNRMLFNLFFHPDKGSHQRLDGTRFVAVVEHLPNILKRESKRRIYLFGDRPSERWIHLIYPYARGPVLVEADQVGDGPEMLSLIANPCEWVVSAIYATRGRFVHDGRQWQPTRYEPVALVGIHTFGGDAQNEPVLVVRLQSGLPAVGEAHFNLGGDVHLTVGGQRGGYHLALCPVTLAEGACGTSEPGIVRICAYAYQSYDDGRIPPPQDVVDLFAQDRVQTRWLQRRASELARLMVGHGEFQPFVTAEEAESRARDQATRLAPFFSPIPATERGEVDPVVQKFTEAGTLVLSDIKADGGGKLGHTAPPTLFTGVAKASLEEAKRVGVLRSYEVFPVGDDLHLLMLHDRGIDANEIHLLAFRTFWRAVWVTEVFRYKPYGLAQDLKIGPATRDKKVEELAEPSEQFVHLLAEFLPEHEREGLPQVRQAFNEWRAGRPATEIRRPFAGNVTGQGPGFAELPLTATSTDVALVAADKAGPAAFNLPIWFALEAVRTRQEQLPNRWPSLAVEIFDVHEHRRIFLDATHHFTQISRLLGAANLYNVKRVWSLKKAVADPGQVVAQLDELLLAASTEKLALIAGGEYVGKDDPVLLGVPELVEPIFELMRDGFYLTQGDERGSHYMMPSPKPLSEAIATVRSRGIEVGLRVGVRDGQALSIQDVYAQPGFLEARERIERLNELLWTAQGSEFTPVGVGARDVEPAYPLMKVIGQITGENSRYGVWVQA